MGISKNESLVLNTTISFMLIIAIISIKWDDLKYNSIQLLSYLSLIALIWLIYWWYNGNLKSYINPKYWYRKIKRLYLHRKNYKETGYFEGITHGEETERLTDGRITKEQHEEHIKQFYEENKDFFEKANMAFDDLYKSLNGSAITSSVFGNIDLSQFLRK